MTYKAAIYELPYGGGKSVILGDPRAPRRRRCCGRWVSWSVVSVGRYVIADDIGTTLDDLRIMREVTARTAAATLAAGQSLPVTARRRVPGDPRGGRARPWPPRPGGFARRGAGPGQRGPAAVLASRREPAPA